MFRNQFVAHRGYQKLYPENTILAHQKAIDAGALYLETDIQLSADLQPVLYHDTRLKRASGYPGKISDYSLAQLIKLPAHEPRRLGQTYTDETIAPLSSFVQLLLDNPSVTAYIEVKAEAIDFAGIEAVYTALSECLLPVVTQCCLMSFDYDFVKHARDRNWNNCGVVLNKWRDLKSPVIKSIKPDVIFCKHQKIPNKTRLDDIGIDFVLYEIANPKLAADWLQRGASRIETFDIGQMIVASEHL